MVRAPESDKQTAQHLDESLARAGAGAVKVAYNTSSMALPLELLNAIRQGEIVSIQGDRAVENVSQRAAQLFGRLVRMPDGPFIFAFVA
jgi:predicted LPLAT superfamily acyltransferase